MTPRNAVLCGDALETLRTLPAESVQCCVTSPPYWGLRDYGMPGQLGLERTPDEYVEHLVELFREVWRVLRADGTLWLNLGDCYATDSVRRDDGMRSVIKSFAGDVQFPRWSDYAAQGRAKRTSDSGLKRKDLVGIPWMVAFALRADGWYLRSDIIWHKPNPMPESVTDRPTKAHEYIFLLSKQERYYYDAEAISDRSIYAGQSISIGPKSLSRGLATAAGVKPSGNALQEFVTITARRNKRSVWTVATAPFPEAHFATFPPALIEPCILAGSRPGDLVLDPFGGAGTVGVVCRWHSRDYLLIDLNPTYCEMAERRIAKEIQPHLWTSRVDHTNTQQIEQEEVAI